MQTEKKLGRIAQFTYGLDEGRLGARIELAGPGWGVMDTRMTWARRHELAKYSEGEWRQEVVRVAEFTRDLLEAAKKTDIAKLVGTPIEAEFDGTLLKSWRVLTEVL